VWLGQRQKGLTKAACAEAGFWSHLVMEGKAREIGLVLGLLAFSLIAAHATDAASVPEVITDLVSNATKMPPGAVEDDVTSQVVETCKRVKAALGDSRSVREMLAATFDRATLTGPLTCLWSQGPVAIWCAKAKLTPDGMEQCKEEASNSETLLVNGKPASTQTGSGPAFGDSGGSQGFIGSKVPADGQVVASFCVVLQHGKWKVHCGYISPDMLKSDDQEFIVRNLSAFAKKA
jgi:hypothetical protein